MSEAHVVGRQLFDLHFYSQKEAYNLQTKVSYLFREKLKYILEKHLTEVSSPGVVIRLEQLNLDLGDIAYEDLEDEFPKRFEEALRKVLPAQVEQAWQNPSAKGSVKRLPENNLLLLQLFLLHGYLPWWSDTKASGDPQEWLDQSLSATPSDLAKMLRRLGKRESVHRLVRQFTEPQLKKIVHVLEPSEAAFIIAYAHDLDVVHDRQPLVQESAEGFRKAKWLVIFTYLLIERGSNFNRRAFLKSTIAGFAAHYNLDYGTLLLQLSEAAELLRKTTGFNGSLPGLVHSLQLEFYEEQKSHLEKQQQHKEHSLIQQHFRIFEHFLLHGSLPPGHAISLPAFDKLVENLLLQMPMETAEFLRDSAHFPGVLERFVERNKEKTLEQTVTVLEPENAPFIIGYSNTLNSIQEKEKFVPVPLSEFKTNKWLFMLRYLLIDRGSHFNTRTFIRSTLTQIAAHYNTTYSKLITLFGMAAEKQVRTRFWPSSLPVIVLELINEDVKDKEKLELEIKREKQKKANKKVDQENVEKENKKAKKNKAVDETETTELPDVNKIYDVLFHFFKEGKMPWWARSSWGKDDVSRLLIQLLDENPNLVITLINEIAKEEEAFDRVLSIIDDNVLLRLLPLLAHGEAHALIPWITSLGELIVGSKKKSQNITSLLYRRLLFEFTVTRKGRFDAALFMNEVLGEIAVRYGITARASMEILADAVEKQAPGARLALAGMLKKVHERAGAGFYRDANAELAVNVEDEMVNVWLKAETENQKEEEERKKLAMANEERRKMLEKEKIKIAENKSEREKLELVEIENELQRLLEEEKKHWKIYTEAELWIKLAMMEEEEQLSLFVPEMQEEKFIALLMQFFPDVNEQKIKLLVRKYKKAFIHSKKETHTPDEQLLFDVLRGRTPMQAHQLDDLVKRLLRTDPDQLKRVLLQLLSLPQLRRRFAASLHETTLIKVLALLYGPSSSVPLVLMSDVLLLVKELFSKSPDAIPLIPIRDLTLLLALRKSSESFTPTQWLQVVLSASGIFSGKQADELALVWENYLAEFPSEWKSEFPILLNHLSDPLYLKRLGDTFLSRLEKIKEKAAMEERRLQMEERKEKQKMEGEIDDERGVFIRNAGIILVWPFMSQLFERVGLVKGISFVSESAAYRAVHLLQYMVNHEEQTPEYNLVLNKLLCNISKAKPVEKEVVLTDEEKNSADQLLGAVIKHWGALGETSPAGLQETFLQRDGQLFFFDHKSELRVERKAFDKLLSRLPWGLSPIKLPWMKKPLYVEWKS